MYTFTYWGSVLMLCVCVYLYHAGDDHRRTANTEAAMMPAITRPVTPPSLPAGVGLMQGTRAAFFGGQLNAAELTAFLRAYKIEHVIDLAAEAKAEAILPGTEERRITQAYGATYWALNIEGYGNRLNQRILATIDSLVDSGVPVFVHCLHGIHRAGVVKGRAYARDLRRWNDIVALLGWEQVVEDTKYDRYTNDVWEQVQRRSYPVTSNKKK